MSNDEYSPGGSANFGAGQPANVSFGNDGLVADAAPAGPVKDITTAQFKSEVIDASSQTPVLIDFWAPWCGPCKQLAPALEAAVAATRGKVKLVKMNIDDHPEVAGQLGVQSIPAVFAFVDGRPVDGFMGAKGESEIREFIAKIAGDDGPSQIDVMLEKAAEVAEQGDIGLAGEIYGQILSAEPENLKARAGFGRLHLDQGNMAAVEGVLEGLDEKQMAETEVAALVTAMELAKQAESLGDTSELERVVETTPDDHAKRLDLAIALNAANKREAAADHLLEIIKQKPDWNDGDARSQLLQFFEAWGMTAPETVSARRKLSSLLFS